MKIQSRLLLGLLAALCGVVHAQNQPAAAAAVSPQAAMEQKAEALTEDQIKQSRDLAGLSNLAQLYNSKQDMQRLSWTLARVSELLPNSGDLKLQLALVYTKIGDKARAYDTLMHMQIQGFGYDIAQDKRFDPIHDTKVWDYIVANLQVNAKQFGEGKLAFELPKGDYLFNALAWDAKRKQFLVGSARAGTIQLADSNGKLSDFIVANAENGLWSADALGVDAAHGKLYVASSASPLFKGFNKDNAGSAGVFEFDLASGKLLHKYILPQSDGAHILNSIAVSKDGQVYVADGARRQLYKIDGAALKPLAANPRLTGISSLALSEDGNTLYMADFALGIFGFDLTKSAAFELAYNPAKLVLGGINDLHWYDGNLIITEGGMVPRRVMRLKLSPDGRSIAGVMPLDVAQPAFAELGQGAVADDGLYFVANRQDALYDGNGVLTEAAELESTQVFRSNLRFAWGQSGVSNDMGPISIGTAKPGDVIKAPAAKPGQPAKPAAGDTKH